MISGKAIIGLPDYQIIGIEEKAGEVSIQARYSGPVCCAHCQSKSLRTKDRRVRHLRHESWGTRSVSIEIETKKYQCRSCLRYFWQRLPGILPRYRATEPFRRLIHQQHWDGISRSRLSQRQKLSSTTIERWFQDLLRRELAQRSGRDCPQILGIDEHFFSRRAGYATTFCDLKNHSVFDVVLGRSEASLEAYLQALPGRDKVRVVCIDLSHTYRSIIRKYFPNAKIVADRFHVIRQVNQHFLACWREIDPTGAKSRGLLSLMRRHQHNLKPEQHKKLAEYFQQFPALDPIYRFKQKLSYLLLNKHRTRKQCKRLIPRLLRAIAALRQSGLAQLTSLGETLQTWKEEIVRMWRFSRNNGITEGFHTKMELLQRQAYGFRRFENYRLRVRVLCC